MARRIKKGNKKDVIVEWAQINEQLGKLGLIVKDIAGDGNCLFRAIADQIEGLPAKHDAYRKKICDFIEENNEQFSPFVEMPIKDYVAKMRKNGTWGGYPEIQACSLLFNVNISIHQLGSPVLEFINFAGNVRTLHLAYHDGEHYSSVRRIDEGINHTGPPLPIVQVRENDSFEWEENTVALATGITNSRFLRTVLYQTGDLDTAIDFIQSIEDLDDQYMENYIEESGISNLVDSGNNRPWEKTKSKKGKDKKGTVRV